MRELKLTLLLVFVPVNVATAALHLRWFGQQDEFEAFMAVQGKVLKGVETFEESILGPDWIASMDNPLCGGVPNLPDGFPFPEGLTVLNLCVQANILDGQPDRPAPQESRGLAAVSAGFLGVASDVVVASTFSRSYDMIFEEGKCAVGLNPLTVEGGSTVQVRVYSIDNTWLGMFGSPVDAAASHFIGVSSDIPIGRINIFDPGDGAEGADNIQMWLEGEGELPCEPTGAENDCCDDAIGTNCAPMSYDSTGANTDGPIHPECQFDGQTYHDLWFEHTAERTGNLNVNTCFNSDYDTDLVVYDGCDCDNLVLLDCNDDSCPGFRSEVNVPVVEGNCYLIRVGGWNDGDQGTGTLTISGAGCSPPCGDGDCGPGEDECSCPADCPGGCQCTIFTNQAEFEAFNEEEGKALKGIEDFEEVPPGGPPIVGFDDPLCGGIPSSPAGSPYPNGLDQLNLCVQANTLGGAAAVPSPHGANGLVFVEFGAGFGESSDIVVAGYFAESLDIMFGLPVPPDQQDNHTGVGFDPVAIFGGGTVAIRVFDKNNVEMVSSTSPSDPAGSNFWGVWCPDTIGRINIFDLGGGAQGGDNIQMWVTCSPCPFCGDGIANQPGEECDGGDDAACPGECQPDCTCLGLVNDDCEDRIEIFDGVTPIDTTDATTDGLPTNGLGDCNNYDDPQIHNDIWFNYAATCNGELTVSTCDTVDFDSKIAIYADCDVGLCPRGGDETGCNDDGPNCVGFSTIATSGVFLGSCYKIRIGGFSAAQAGTGTVEISCETGTICGDAVCDIDEHQCSCPADCPGECQCTVFTNQAEFEAFNEAEGKLFKGLEDFEEVPPGPGTVGFDDPLCGGIPNGPFPNGIDQLNLCVQANFLAGAPNVPAPRGNNALFVIEPGEGLGNSSDVVVANYLVDSFDLMFGPPVPPDQQDNHTGVGFDTVTLQGGPSVEIRVYDKNNAEMVSTSSPANAAGSNFWGVWCPDTIGRINIFDPSGNNGAEGGDNIQMWVEDEGDPFCGDGMCDQDEDECSCPDDCAGECLCTVFTNQAEFEAFNMEHGKQLKGIEGFEETPEGTGIQGFTDPLCGGIPNGPFPNGLDLLNLCVQSNLLGGAPDVPSPRGLNALVFVPWCGIDECDDFVLANYFVDSFDVMFGLPVPPDQQDNHTGVGFDTMTLEGGNSVEIRVYDKNNVEMMSATSPADEAGSNFWSVWCENPIARVNVFDPGNGAEGGDNIQMWVADGSPLCGECPTDVDHSGDTGAFDLAFLLGSWGPCSPGAPCECLDADSDGVIAAADLAVLLGAWGSCP